MAVPDEDIRQAIRLVEHHEWRIDALDEWRKEQDARTSVLESKVNDLRFTDAVADALAKQLNARRKIEFTLLQKVGAGMFAVVLVLAPVALQKAIG